MKITNLTISPIEGQTNGIFRLISSKLRIPDLDGYSLIKISVDSIQNSSISYKHCIGYTEIGKTPFFASSNSQEPHWYQVNMNFFSTTLTAYSLSMNKEHYHPTWDFMYSDDGLNWSIADHPINQMNPEKSFNIYTLKKPVTAQYFKIVTNSQRGDGGYSLSIGNFDIYGTVRWGKLPCSFSNSIHISPICFIIYFFV